MPNGLTTRVTLPEHGDVDKCPSFFLVRNAAFMFEDAQGGEHRVVGKPWGAAQGRGDFADGRALLAPQHIHEPELGVGQCSRRSARHCVSLAKFP